MKTEYPTTREIVWRVREAEGDSVNDPGDICERMKRIKDEARESFYVLTANSKNRIIDEYLISLGSLCETIVCPREVFKPAILDSAFCIFLVHNHPSGDPSPSPEDFAVTERLQKASAIVGIRIQDHVIIGSKGFYSFRTSTHILE